MKLNVMIERIITETREIEVDDKFIALINDDKDDEAIAMVEKKVGLNFGDENTKEDEPFIYCVETENGNTVLEW